MKSWVGVHERTVSGRAANPDSSSNGTDTLISQSSALSRFSSATEAPRRERRPAIVRIKNNVTAHLVSRPTPFF